MQYPEYVYWIQKKVHLQRLKPLTLRDIPPTAELPYLPLPEQPSTVGKTFITIKFGKMMVASRLPEYSSGLLHPSFHKLSFQINRCQRTRFACYKPKQPVSEKICRGSSLRKPCTSRHVVSVGSNELSEEPFWPSLIRETIWGVRSLSLFLVEQPSQLKYIEWPSFVSTLKTAILTLVLVAALIVALASVDSILCYVLALLLRRTP
ncbi:hypothetical protein V6N13_018378 [Hibiscus sabdariffa]|uniref:Uncharacterized protein n=2 Tax=Hibiscus sabdariffa TaxID=183260 RepID=A0ABR1ZM67_9ROSI